MEYRKIEFPGDYQCDFRADTGSRYSIVDLRTYRLQILAAAHMARKTSLIWDIGIPADAASVTHGFPAYCDPCRTYPVLKGASILCRADNSPVRLQFLVVDFKPRKAPVLILGIDNLTVLDFEFDSDPELELVLSQME